MSERLKKVLFVVIFIVFSGLVAFAIYWVFFRPTVTPTLPPEEAEEVGGQLPGAGGALPREPGVPTEPGAFPGAGEIPTAPTARQPQAGETIILHDGISQASSKSPSGNATRYYNPIDSKFYTVDTDGVIAALSDNSFPNVEQVTWGNNTDQAILSFPDGSKIYYDFTTNEQKTIPKHWDDFYFAPNDSKVVAKSLGVSSESRFLIVADPDGSNPKAIEPLGDNESRVTPSWTGNNQIIAYAETGEAAGFDSQQIYVVGQQGENFKALAVEGRGFTPLWSPGGQTVIYSVWNAASEYKPELWVSGGAPGNMNRGRTQLQLQTWANKCVWESESIVYCAVPSSLPRGAGLQPELFYDTTDVIYKINIETGSKTPLGSPEGGLAVTRPVLTDDRTKLIFTDPVSGALYSFRLQ